MSQNDLAQLVKAAREKRGWTQEDLAEKVGVDVSTVRRWEAGRTQPYSRHIELLRDLFAWDAAVMARGAENKETAEPPAIRIWSVPYRRHPYFTGREALLERVHEVLQTSHSALLTHALVGLGGIGKTQVALEYAYRYASAYDAVFWVQADSEHALISGLAQIARALNLREKDEQDKRFVVRALQQWLQTQTRWLLVFDNVTDAQLLDAFLVQGTAGYQGHILLTTRNQALGTIATPISVDLMELEEGMSLLLRRAKKIPGDGGLDQAEREDLEGARSIVEALNRLPLAIDQAAAYLDETACSLATYLDRYQARRKALLERRGRPVSRGDHPDSVMVTFALSFEMLQRDNPAAAQFLQWCAFLAPEDIPEQLLTWCKPILDPPLQTLATDSVRFDEAIADIRRYSLMQRLVATASLSMHPVVQAVLQEALDDEARKRWIAQVVLAIAFLFSSTQGEDAQAYDRLIPHALACATLAEQHHLVNEEIASLYLLVGRHATRQALFAQADHYCQLALLLSTQLFGPEHDATASALVNLALLAEEKRWHVEAQSLLERALAIYERTRPPSDPDRTRTLARLARCHWFQGHLLQAEARASQALVAAEASLGRQDLGVADSLITLGLISREQGKARQAKKHLLGAKALYERHLPSDHLFLGSCLHALALNYALERDYRRFREFCLRALDIFEQQLPEHHPERALCLSNLADACALLGAHDEAEEYSRRALSIYESIKDFEHLDIAQPLISLATSAYLQGKDLLAQTLYQRAIAVLERSQVPEHPDLLAALQGYARLLSRIGREQEAQALQERAKAIEQRIWGAAHQ